jgi:hypothetical protein
MTINNEFDHSHDKRRRIKGKKEKTTKIKKIIDRELKQP